MKAHSMAVSISVGGKGHICCVLRVRGLALWCQKNGYLALTEEKFDSTKVST